MIDLISGRERGRFSPLLKSMHADRKRVFVDLFGWKLATDGDHEKDAFDDDAAEYLVLADAVGGHRASIRLLRTDRPHLMTELFSHLCEEELPRGAHIREITRFCIAPRGRAAGRLEARNMLAKALIEYGELSGVTGYTAVCHMGLLQQVLSAGWACRPLGLPQLFAGEMVGAFLIEVGPGSCAMMSESWRWDAPALRLAACTNALAA